MFKTGAVSEEHSERVYGSGGGGGGGGVGGVEKEEGAY